MAPGASLSSTDGSRAEQQFTEWAGPGGRFARYPQDLLQAGRETKETLEGLMNDRERELWVLNDEGLYRWWKQEGGSLRAFIKRYRKYLTDYINNRLGKKEDT